MQPITTQLLSELAAHVQSILVYQNNATCNFTQLIKHPQLTNVVEIRDVNYELFEKIHQFSLVDIGPTAFYGEKIAISWMKKLQLDLIIVINVNEDDCDLVFLLFNYLQQTKISISEAWSNNDDQRDFWLLNQISKDFYQFLLNIVK